MDVKMFQTYLLGELTLEFALAFYLFAIIGMVFTQLLHYEKKRQKLKKQGTKLRYSFTFWVQDNSIRWVTNFLAIALVLRFYDDIPLKEHIDFNMFGGLCVGMSIDVIVVLIQKTVANVSNKRVNA